MFNYISFSKCFHLEVHCFHVRKAEDSFLKCFNFINNKTLSRLQFYDKDFVAEALSVKNLQLLKAFLYYPRNFYSIIKFRISLFPSLQLFLLSIFHYLKDLNFSFQALYSSRVNIVFKYYSFFTSFTDYSVSPSNDLKNPDSLVNIRA